MTARHVVAGVLLALGIGVTVLCCLGVLLARDVYARLHYAAPAGTLGALLISAAIVVNEAFSQAGIKALILLGILLVTSPLLTHATARAARIRAHGALLTDEERRKVHGGS